MFAPKRIRPGETILFTLQRFEPNAQFVVILEPSAKSLLHGLAMMIKTTSKVPRVWRTDSSGGARVQFIWPKRFVPDDCSPKTTRCRPRRWKRGSHPEILACAFQGGSISKCARARVAVASR
jgi:hypothetical protein